MRIPRTTLPSTESGPAYSIAVEAGFVRSIRNHLKPEQFSKVLIITDRTVASLHLKSLKHALGAPAKVLEVPRGEKAKDLRVAQRLWHKMLQLRTDRNSLVINFGGGSVCDIGGFAASTYMRGVPFINIPTTLLAQVDASIGGKNGINFSGLKNYIGTFKEPLLVGCDAELLVTLPRR